MGSGNDTKTKFIFYHYDPSLAAAVVFIVLFAGTTLMHFFQMVKRRTWYFLPFFIGGCFEVVGYVGRVLSSQETPNWSLGPFIIQSTLLLVAPALFSASIYMILGRIVRLTNGEQYSLIRSNWLTKIFVGADILSFLTQAAGAGILSQSKTESDTNKGENVITVGLGLQVLAFSLFIVVAGFFHYRINKHASEHAKSLNVPWQTYLKALYAASILVLVRSLFRIVEYVQGQNGTLLGHEVYLYVFDSTLMFFTMVMFNIWHAGRIINKTTTTMTTAATMSGGKSAHPGAAYSQDSEYALEEQPMRV